ncbi:MAG TPA: hypothetical protein DEQ34_03125 [Balneolaceae bacterium]|mgnify:FL=1|nr:hypothetical protein [Balneolaceae bacterium]|tara:strand:- start:63985 stop:64218 length:234 start_codon:yes stop_codon:yes gene_type:complete
MQEDSLAVVDTLTQVYSQKWAGPEMMDQTNAFIAFMYSNNLIFVVLGVTLIIWAVLLFFLFRVDKKITTLEEKIKND